MKQCGLRKAFSDGGLIGYTPTAGEQDMLKSLDERMGWGPKAAAPVTPAANQAPAATTMQHPDAATTMQHPDADDTGTLPGQAGYNQNGANATSNKLNGMFDKLRGGTASQRFGAGQAIGAMLRKNPRLMSSDDLIDRMDGLSTRSARVGLGEALDGQLMRGYAQGGTIDPDALMREMAAKYGTGGGQPQPAPAPKPAPQPAQVQAPAPKPTLLQGLHRLATGNVEGRMKAAGFKQGGTVDGKGYIHGEKGVDKVPAKIAESGEDILVSHGERIVNKKQNAALEKLAAAAGMGLDEYLEKSTGEPVGPSMKQGLRAAQGGWEVDPAGNVRRPGQVAGALPNPNAGGPVAVRNNTAWTSGGGGFKADPGAIDVDFKPVPPQPMALPAPAQTPAPPRTDLPYRAGQAVGKGVDWLKNNKGAALGFAGDALAVYNAHKLASEHDDFYNSPDVPVVEKGLQAGRDIAKTAIPFAAGAIGTGAGTVASPTLVVNPVTGGLAGYAAGTAAVSGIDKEGQALKDFKAKNAAGSDIRAKHEAIMNDTTGHKSDKPIVTKLTDAEKAAAKAGVAQAKAATLADKPLDWMREQGVNVNGLRRNVMEDMNRINANGPDKVATGELRQINTANGPVYAARDKNGQLVVTAGLDRTPEQQAAATKSGYEQAVAQAQKDRDSLARIQRERASFDAFDPSITDPNARASGLRRVGLYQAEDQAKAAAQLHREDREANLGLRREMMEEQKRQFDITALAADAAARRTAQKEGIKEFDDLVKSAGYEGDEAAKFTDWFRGNYAGRRHLIDGKQVDVPGFEDMAADERRAHMTNAKAMYEWVKKANAAEVKDRTSMAVPKRLRERGLTFDDANKGTLLGVPDVFSSDNDKRHSLANIAARRMLPQYFGSDRMIDELDDQGNVLRSWSKPSLRGAAGPWGSQDVDVFLKDRMPK